MTVSRSTGNNMENDMNHASCIVHPASCTLPVKWDDYRARFVGSRDAFGEHWRREERTGYTPVRRGIIDRDLESHVRGERVLGTYLLLHDGTAQSLVFDIDGPTTEEGRKQTLDLTRRLVGGLETLGIKALWFNSGCKGYHLWLCFGQPVPARTLRHWANAWLDGYRPFPEGIMVEIFPKQERLSPGALGSLIRLPLGRHPETGRWSMVLDAGGSPVSNPWTVIGAAPFVNPESLTGGDCGFKAVPSLPEPPAEVLPLVEGCAFIKALAERAAYARNLRHTERLALLYLLGPTGDAGRAYLHRIIALCGNYNPRITEGWIQKLEEGHKPVRCATLKEWLKDYLPEVECPCPVKGRSPSPLNLLIKQKTSDPAVKRPDPTDEDWGKVITDLFDESKTEENSQ